MNSTKCCLTIIHWERASHLSTMRLPAYEFAIEVERQIEALTLEQFHLRQGLSKVLQEEWYPLARLGLHLKQPGLEVEVEGFGDCGVADGRIIEVGFRDREFDVQVTYVHDYEEALRRALMVQQGFAPGAGPISRSKRNAQIEASMAAVDMDYNVKRLSDALAERFTKKIAIAYPPNTTLILAFEDMTLQGRAHWGQLFSCIDQQVKLTGSGFESVYLLNTSTNELHKAAP